MSSSDASKPPSSKRSLLLGLLLMVVTCVAYWPAMQDGGFIWDDDDYVLNNTTLRDAHGLKEIWADPAATPQYYPLVHSTYWLEYRMWELNPTGYHVTNVLLHALAALLLWRVLKMLALPGAWLAAALFALHPVHVESVAWITERKNVLSGVFYLASALVYLKWLALRHEGMRMPVLYLAALVLFVCALLSKTITCSLPAALLLVAWWKADPEDGAWWKRHVPPLLPFFVVGLGLALMTVWLEKHHVGADGAEWDLSLIDRGLIAGRALWFYIGKLLWPVGLCFNYTRWEIDAGVWWQYLFPLAFAAMLGVLWWKRVAWGRGPLMAMLFFAGSLFPALGFIDVYPMRYSFVADHFQYLANISVLVLISVGLVRLASRIRSSRAQVLIPAVLLPLLLIMSWRQCGIYQGLEELWQDTLKRNPQSFMSYNNLGRMRMSDGRHEEAIKLFERCIELNPNEVTAINNLGVSLSALGRVEEAEAAYLEAISTQADDPQAHHNLGVLKAQQGLIEEAERHYRKALELDESLAVTHVNLASTLAGKGNLGEAISHHHQAIALEPHFAQAYFKFGELLQSQGLIRQAADQYRLALAEDPDLAMAYNHLGLIAAGDQLYPAAMDYFGKALDLMPGFPEAHRNLALILASMGQNAKALEHYRRAALLAPQSAPMRFAYAEFMASLGDKAALPEARQALKLEPEQADAHFKVGKIAQQLGDLTTADAHYQLALSLDPKHVESMNHFAVLLAGSGNLPGAIKLVRRAVELAPDNAEYHNNLGVMLVRHGKRDEAKAALEKAVALNPNYAEARKNLQDLIQLMNSSSQP